MIALGVGNDAQFARFAAALGHPEWLKDPRFASNRDRVVNRELVDGAIGEALAHDSADAWLARLQAAGIPCGRINTVAQALEDPQTAARAMVETAEHPAVGTLKMVGMPFKFSATPTSVRRAPPALGEHTEDILRDLGIDAGAIAALRAERVI
jgi:crotonobetainyl-CoA:carnitine CoA-transferase CaiB-like acyl-CoA transferase